MTTRKTMTRRDALRGALMLGGGALAGLGGPGSLGGVLGRLGHAQAMPEGAPDRYYVFCYFTGGWDVLLGLDPRDPRLFTDGNVRSTRIQPGYERVERPDADLVRAGNLVLGPYIGDLARHHQRLAVIRGMSMETLTHEVGRRRFLTGKPPSGLQARGSNASTWLASRLGAEHPIPNLSVLVEAYNKDQPNYASALRVSSVSDLLRALRPANPVLPGSATSLVDARLAQAASCPDARRSQVWQAAEASRLKAIEMVYGGYDGLFDFMANTNEMAALRQHYGITSANTSPEVQAALAVQAITGGVSRAVSIQVTNSLDTHFDDWETDQGPNQMRGFNAVSRLVEDLGSREYGSTGYSWLDKTVIVGFSEFSRTPMLNARGGRDHHLTNSCFLLGGNIRGGQALGASSDVGMEPLAIDLASGRVDPGGSVVRPEHVLQTLYEEVGIHEEPDLRVPGIPALLRT